LHFLDLPGGGSISNRSVPRQSSKSELCRERVLAMVPQPWFPKSPQIRVGFSPPCTLCATLPAAPSRPRRGTHLPRQFPGSIKSRNFRFSSRRGAPSVVSLPVGRHYPGASRRFIVHGEREREREREKGRARRYAPRARCRRTERRETATKRETV